MNDFKAEFDINSITEYQINKLKAKYNLTEEQIVIFALKLYCLLTFCSLYQGEIQLLIVRNSTLFENKIVDCIYQQDNCE